MTGAGGTPDVVVAGAGVWGLAVAWRCARAGASVTVVDDGAPPAGHVAAGMLGAWAEAEPARPALGALMRRAAEAWPGFAAELADAAGEDPGYEADGALLVASRPEHLGDVRHRIAEMAESGPSRAWTSGSQLRELEPGLGTAVAGGVAIPDEARVDPRRVLACLRAALARLGVRIVGGRAAAATPGGVALDDGTRLSAGRVVVAAGTGGAALGDVDLRPVKGQILRLAAAAGAAPVRMTVRTPSVYVVPRASGEVVVGATSEELGDRRVTAGAVLSLLEEAVRAVPELRELELRECAAGLRPAVADGMPALGADDRGVVWATGGGRHGVLLAPVAAGAAAALALGGAAPAWAGPFAPGGEGACASR